MEIRIYKKPADGAEGITIRQYHHPKDSPHIQRVFWDATMTGKNSPYVVGMASIETPSLVIYVATTISLILAACYASDTLQNAVLPMWVTRSMTVQAGRLFGGIGFAGYLYIKYHQFQVKRLFRVFLDDGLAGEIGNVVESFSLRVGENGVCEPTGPSGFWVAEEAGEVVGFVGLNKNLRPHDLSIGDVRRLAVAPTHQGKGVAQLLAEALEAHARSHCIQALEITTSVHNKAALKFYEKNGWEHAGRQKYHGFSVIVRRRKLRGSTEIEKEVSISIL